MHDVLLATGATYAAAYANTGSEDHSVGLQLDIRLAAQPSPGRWVRLVQAYIYDQAIDRTTYDRELADLEEALTFTHLELRDATMEDFDMEASLGYARAVVTKTYKLWEAADPDQKRRLQKLILPEGLTFDGKHLELP